MRPPSRQCGWVGFWWFFKGWSWGFLGRFWQSKEDLGSKKCTPAADQIRQATWIKTGTDHHRLPQTTSTNHSKKPNLYNWRTSLQTSPTTLKSQTTPSRQLQPNCNYPKTAPTPHLISHPFFFLLSFTTWLPAGHAAARLLVLPGRSSGGRRPWPRCPRRGAALRRRCGEQQRGRCAV